jgi:flagellar hook-associated protein 2
MSTFPITAPLTFTGVSSYSSDLQQILQRAVRIASLPQQQLQLDQTKLLSQEKSLSDLASVVSRFTSSLASLGLLGANGAVTATSSNPDAVTAQVTGSPAPQSYTLAVTSAASAAQASTALSLPDSNTTPVRADGIYSLTLGGNTQTFNLLATGSGRTAGTMGNAAPSSPDSVTVSFGNGLSGSITASLKSFFIGNAAVGGAGAGDTVTVNFTSDDNSIQSSITTAPLSGGEDAAALANLLNAQISANAALNGKVSFSAANGALKIVESDSVGTGFTFTSSHTGAVTTGLDSGGAIGGESAREIAAALNAQVAANPALSAAGVAFTASGGQVKAAAAAGQQFIFTATDSAQGTGFISGLAGKTQVVGYANTLAGLRDYINSQEASLGVRATVINTSSDPANPRYDLSLAAEKTGVTTLTLLDSNGAGLLPAGGTLGTNAVFSINGGAAVTNSSNTIANMVPGLNLTIVGPTGGTPAVVTVAADRNALQNALQEFAANYNAVLDRINMEIGPNAGPLSGSSVVYQISSALRAITGYQGSRGSIQSMAALGLLLDDKGHLSFDASTFQALTGGQINDAIVFLGSTTTGFAGAAYSRLSQISDPVNGAIQTTRNFLDASDQRLAQSIARQQDRVNALQASLTAQLSQADTILAQLQSQQNLLAGLFKAQQALSLANTLA